MSVAPSLVPSTVDGSKLVSRRGSNGEEAEAVGAVLVLLREKTEESVIAYHPSSSPAVEQGNGAPRSFVAVLAPSSKAALATLLSQPPGTYLLVNEEDAAITVYVKFRQAVRAVALVKGKELKKQEHSIDWSNPKTQDTPIHRLYLGLEAFSHVEHCWKRFLPQVQAIVFELCCEPYLDEDVKLEDWVPGLSVPPFAGVCSAALMPNDFGFYLLATLSETRETAVQVRQVEFDFKKSVVTVADGSVKPSAFLLATNFATKRTFEPEFTFVAIRDNFLRSDLVILKETSIAMPSSQQSGFQNCIELSVNDPEVALLSAVHEGCEAIVPNEPLPETFVAVLSELHTHFATMSLSAGGNIKPMSWPPQKLKMVSRIIPVILDLMVASAASSEAEDSDLPTRMRPTVAGKKKSQLQVQFARVLRFDLLFLALRSDDAVICRLVHQVAQLLGAPNCLPSELVELVRDLTALSPLFLRLFLRSQGTGALWKSLRSQEQAKPAAEVRKSRRSLRDLVASVGVGNALQTSNSDLKTSLFGKKTTAQTKSRKSLLLVSSSSSPTLPSPKPLAFARFSPSTIHLELGAQFELPEAWSNAPTVKSHAFCCCDGPGLEKSGSPGVLGLKPSPKTAYSKQTPKMSTYELILQLSLRLLYAKTSITSWDRDVALLLRLDALHDQLFHEIESLARKRAKMTDEVAKTPIFCRLRVVITCLSTLCRLEMKRRRDMSSAIGDKKFWAFLHLSRDQIREFNANLRKKSTNTDDQEEEEEEGVEAVDDSPLVALIELFQWLPKAILTEWLVLSLKELLQMLSELNNAVKTATKAGFKERNLMVYTLQLLQVLRLILERTSDGDLQTVLIRALASDSSAIVSLLRFVLSTQTSRFDAFTREYCVAHRDLLQFLTAFVRLDLALPTRNDWDLNNRSLLHNDIEVDGDAEVLEQKKDELLMTLLAPDLNTEVESTEDESPGLWAFILGLTFPSQLNGDSDDVTDFQGSEGMSGLAVAFRSTSRPPELLTEEADDLFLVLKAFLLLQQALYTSQEPDNTSSPVDYDHCIASHLYHIEQYSDRITANAGQEDPKRVRHLIALHLRCLVVLASRRSQSPGIQQAFDRVPILPSLLQRLLPPIGPREMAENPPPTRVSSDYIGCEAHFLPPLKLPSLETGGGLQPLTLQPNFSTLSLGLLQARDAATSHFLVAERDLHVLVIVLVASYALLDANLELDEAICPRVSVPGPDSQGKSDLLWTLQQHLAVVELDQRCFERLMVELEAVQAFVNASRVSAIRLLLRFLCPNRFDREMYTTPIEMASTEHDAEASKRSEYVAKGAFATVYRSQTAVPRPAAVAFKSLGHQKRAGELCPVSGLYNEVAILKKLRGEKAASQILDFGNHHAEKSFEIIMEFCPNSLSEWRKSFARAETPFRSCLILILRAFAEICCCLTRIHRAGVCHFDIKADNVLVRSTASELSHRLLLEPNHGFSGLKHSLCFADFGEAMAVAFDQIPIRTFTFSSFSSASPSPVASEAGKKRTQRYLSLSRTRGTEAIKSPEVLTIKGSDDVKARVTLASDIWSMGCLLYELVTQELLFEHDDWAGLYAHIVVTQDRNVLRSDHEEKLLAALKPANDQETAAVTQLIALCNQILARSPTCRPSLKMISKKVREFVDQVRQLPLTTEDEAFFKDLVVSTSPEPSSTPVRTPDLSPVSKAVERLPFSRAPYMNDSSSSNDAITEAQAAVTVPVRLFWSFFLACDVVRTSASQMVTSSLGSGAGPISKDVLAMETFEAQHEADFTHFVYFSWHDDPALKQGEATSRSAGGLVKELHEEAHRTCFLLDPQLQATASTVPQATRLFTQLVQHARQYFPVLQRRLRQEAGCILFVVMGKDEHDTKDLQNVLVGLLLFFLQRGFAMTPFQALGYFARDCAQFFDYPPPEFIQHLYAYDHRRLLEIAVTVEMEVAKHAVQCQCGASVFAVEATALKTALASQQCTCKPENDVESDEDAQERDGCPCFHPFPSRFSSSMDSDDDAYPVDSVFIHDGIEERLVLSMESRSKQDEEVRWVHMPAAAVGRLESSAFRWEAPVPPLLRSSSSVSGSNRSLNSEKSSGRQSSSRFEKFKRRASFFGGDSSRALEKEAVASSANHTPPEPHELLIRGLQRRRVCGGASSSSDGATATWELYECQCCRLPICATSTGKIALPVLLPRPMD